MSELVLCEWCGELAKYRGLKLCAKHYQRIKAHGDLHTHERTRQECCVPGCFETVKAYGYCVKHWRRMEKHGTVDPGKWTREHPAICVVPGCGGLHHAMGLCKVHADHEHKHGHPIWKTLDRQKVHNDRPWREPTVTDVSKIVPGDVAHRDQ